MTGGPGAALAERVALVTGAAGAIGWGICRGLLGAGCRVAAADVSPEGLEGLAGELGGERVRTIGMDVADEASVASGFESAVAAWGRLDIVVVNAGIALAGPIVDMDLEAFRAVQRVNTDGALLTLRAAGRILRDRGRGGDIVLISTKNVFMPGAGFGAYSATKAAAHQLARIASQEFAAFGVRVNMVAPDAVFGEGAHKSGLWAAVGPSRMQARGLDEKGLEAYYRKRNLLQARVTAEDVANAVLFFVTRRTPTTGATLPVDGGLPEATPR
ncbi:MAG: SDR family oxidoreductase [Lentisphaerae bacterium]|nr:SDR family oxidoreductase [Lentisphaerota bacterium]